MSKNLFKRQIVREVSLRDESENSHHSDMQEDETSQAFDKLMKSKDALFMLQSSRVENAKPSATTLVQSFGKPGSNAHHLESEVLHPDESTFFMVSDIAEQVSASAGCCNSMINDDGDSCDLVEVVSRDGNRSKVNCVLLDKKQKNKPREVKILSVLQSDPAEGSRPHAFVPFLQCDMSSIVDDTESKQPVADLELQTNEEYTLDMMADLAQQISAKASGSCSNSLNICDGDSCGKVTIFRRDPKKVDCVLYLSQEDGVLSSNEKGVMSVYEFCDGKNLADTVVQESVGSSDAKPLAVHLISYNGGVTTIYMCNYCHYTNRYRCFLYRHLKSHSNERPHQCEMCELYFKSISALRAHVNSHTRTLLHKCDSCNLSFMNYASLSRHRRSVHAQKKPYQCSLCDYAFLELGKLKRHIMRQHMRPRYQCDICQALFNQSNHMEYHKQLLHSGNRRVFRCEFCPAAYSSNQSVKRHVQKLHSSDISPHSKSGMTVSARGKPRNSRDLEKHAIHG